MRPATILHMGLASAVVALLLTPGTVLADDPLHFWSQRFGDTSNDNGVCVSVDRSANIFFTGTFWGDVDFGGGPLSSAGGDDIFLVKYDPDGNHLWSRSFGDIDRDRPRAVTVDPAGDVLLTGSFRGTVDFGGGPLTSAGGSDAVVAKFDRNGNHIWSRRFGDVDYDWARGAVVGGSGHVSVIGCFAGTVDFGGGPLTSAGEYDVFLAQYDSDGYHVWSQRFGGSGDDLVVSVIVDGADNLAIAGYFEGTIDFGGGPMTSSGCYDLFVAKFGSAGNHLWSQRFGGTSAGYGTYGTCAFADPSGNLIVTGYFDHSVDLGGGLLTSAGYRDVFVAKYDPDGNHLWSRCFGEAHDDRSFSVAVSESGDLAITGYFEDTIDFGGGPLTSAGEYEMFLAEFDSGGVHLWSQSFGGVRNESGRSIAIDILGNIIATGYFQDTVDFGGGPLTSAGMADAFLIKYGRGATPVELVSFDALPSGTSVEVRWATGHECQLLGFHLLRSNTPQLEDAVRVTNSLICGNRRLYSFIDEGLSPGRYWYWIQEVTMSGESRNYGPRLVLVERDRALLSLAQTTPNPMRESTEVVFSLPARGPVSLAIYDISGRIVRLLLDDTVGTPGSHRVNWDGNDDRGQRVTAGIYVCRLRFGESEVERKLLVLR